MKFQSTKAKVRKETPMSFNTNEVEVTFIDNVVDQEDADHLVKNLDVNDYEELISIADEIKNHVCNSDPKYRRYFNSKPYDVQVHNFEYDVYPEPFKGKENEVLVMLCMCSSWSKDWGGEVIFFEQSEPSEVLASYPGRIIVQDGETWSKVTQPNVAAVGPLKYLFFRLN